MFIVEAIGQDCLRLIWEQAGSTKANESEHKTGLGWVFNFKLGCFDDVHVYLSMWMHAHIYSCKLGPGLVLLA
jgi:hypothetical protein